MRVHFYSELEITRRCFELRRQQSAQVDFDVGSILCFWSSLLQLHSYSMCICELVLGDTLCFSVYCLRFYVGVMCIPLVLWVPDLLHVTSDVEEQCYSWLRARRKTRLFICSAPCEAHCLFRGEEEVCLKPVAGSRGGLSAPHQVV